MNELVTVKMSESFPGTLNNAEHTRANPWDFITIGDLTILYKWFETVTPTSLLYKVWFDVTYYFMLSEYDVANLLEMRRDSFILHLDHNKRRYITLKDQEHFKGLAELADNNSLELRMYEIPGSPRCPVTSLVTYVQRIHPAVNVIWQRPRAMYRPSEPGIWYDMFPLGLARLSRMMGQLSRLAGLPVIYRTCHVHNTALRHLELAGVNPELMRRLRARPRRQEQRACCQPDADRCNATINCLLRAQMVRKRKAAEM